MQCQLRSIGLFVRATENFMPPNFPAKLYTDIANCQLIVAAGTGQSTESVRDKRAKG
jgi:hypothetical protein